VRIALLILALVAVARDAPAHGVRAPSTCAFATAVATNPRPTRTAHWAETLDAVDVENVVTRTHERVRLYRPDGEIDDAGVEAFSRVASNDALAHPLTPRVVQLVMKAAYHFAGARVFIVSAWRANAGRHGTGDAVDFKLAGVHAPLVAAYLRDVPRAGVGIYTHPRTQFVHVDVRDASYHWIDASAPGKKWREGMLRDPGGKQRDASWTAERDLP
jgi:uncharacterized protein YcbK (DUF882 family)